MNDFFDITKTTGLSTERSVPSIGDNSAAVSTQDKLKKLASSINIKHRNVIGCISEAAMRAVECGCLLIDARKLVPDGGWHRWLKDNTTVSIRTAQRWIEAAEQDKPSSSPR